MKHFQNKNPSFPPLINVLSHVWRIQFTESKCGGCHSIHINRKPGKQFDADKSSGNRRTSTQPLLSVSTACMDNWLHHSRLRHFTVKRSYQAKNNVKSMDMNSKGKGICLKYVTIGRPALFFWYLYLSVCCFHCDVSPFFLFLFRSLSPISDVLNSCYFILNFPAQQIFYHFHILIIVWQSPCTCSLVCTTYQIIDQRYQDNLSALRVLYSTVQYSMVQMVHQ